MLTLRRKDKEPEVLPGADSASDCQTAVIESEEQLEEEGDDDEPDVNWKEVGNGRSPTASPPLQDWRPHKAGWARLLEAIALKIESPVNRLVGSLQFNPLYHTGTIAFFLLLIVGLTGLYLFMFFQYGYDLSYNAVNRIEGQFIGRTMRAIHRYASGALVITTLLHAYRTLFLEHFRGPRWLAWVTGVVMTLFLWVAGVTGYWLIWDERAQVITDSFIGAVRRFTTWGPQLDLRLIKAELIENTWWIIGLIMAAHILLFVVTAVFFWLHIKRLSRAKWLPDSQWTIGLGIVLLLGAIVFPLGMLPKANSLQLPGAITLDPIFLFYLPVTGVAGVLLWLALGTVTVIGLVLPWLSKGQRANLPKVHIIKDRCTGCTKCALDCPYGAIQMVERHDGKPHKFIAIEDPSLCVSCGICVGSCDGVAVTLGSAPPEILWDEVATRLAFARAKAPKGEVKVIFTCERHAAHGAKPFLAGNGRTSSDSLVEVIPLPCVGTAPPDLLVRTLNAGATAVQVVGCPPDDCSNREGNLWTEQRLIRERVPRLKRAYANAPVLAAWLPPDQFAKAIEMKPLMQTDPATGETTPDYLNSRRMSLPFTWRNIATAFALLAVVMAGQIFFTNLPFTPQPAEVAVVRVILDDPSAPFGGDTGLPVAPHELSLEIDDELHYTEVFTAAGADPLFFEQTIPPGEHHVRLSYLSEDGRTRITLYEATAVLEPGQVIRIASYPPTTTACYQPCGIEAE